MAKRNKKEELTGDITPVGFVAQTEAVEFINDQPAIPKDVNKPDYTNIGHINYTNITDIRESLEQLYGSTTNGEVNRRSRPMLKAEAWPQDTQPERKRSRLGKELNVSGLYLEVIGSTYIAFDANDREVFQATGISQYLSLAQKYHLGTLATKQDNPDKPDLTEYIYRCILSNDGLNRVFLKIPKGINLTDEELLNAGYEGRQNIRILDYLPNREKEILFKKKKKSNLKKKEAIKYIPANDFYTKTNDLFIDFKPFTLKHLYDTLVRSEGRAGLIASCNGKTCKAFEVIYDKNIKLIGLTTGLMKDGLVQVIGLTNDCGSLNEYNAKSNFVHAYMDPRECSGITSSSNILKFFRVKVTSAAKTNSLMTNYKNYRLKLVGEIFGADRISFNMHDFNGSGAIPCFSFYTQTTDNALRFHPDDFEVRLVDIKKLPLLNPKSNKDITQNSICTIVDDRRLNGLVRGDRVKVLSIKTSKSNMKNSVVTVMEVKSKNRFIVLLKQLKKNVDQTQK